MSDGGANPPPFSRRAILLIAGGAALSLILGVYFSIFGDKNRPDGDPRNHTFSVSALGHRGFIALLESLKIPVVVSRYHTEQKVGKEALLVLLEPQPGAGRERKLIFENLLHGPEAVLLALPKRDGTGDANKPEWIQSSSFVGEGAIDPIVNKISPRMIYKRMGDDEPRPVWTTNEFSVEPSIANVQLIMSDDVRPLLACDKGILVAEIPRGEDGRFIIVSDPDIFANHGIDDGENARLVIEIVERARIPGRSIMIDETTHGFEQIPSIWRELLQFPLGLVFIDLGFLFLILVWAGAKRFGDPRPAPGGIAPGKEVLLENTAELLAYCGRDARALEHYLQSAAVEAAAALRIPADDKNLPERLDTAGRQRKTRDSYTSIAGAVAEIVEQSHSPGARWFGRGRANTNILLVASQIYLWKQHILYGPTDHRPNG